MNQIDDTLRATADCLDEIAEQLQEHVDAMRLEAEQMRHILAPEVLQ